ncbi:cell surface protein SprA [Ravibacter arvi]|uniref:Cell surface protein SprA n=2 Tax=Ravibacter arvi TaxID=2051041 RepID=A0ABP8LQ10_9BACT
MAAVPVTDVPVAGRYDLKFYQPVVDTLPDTTRKEQVRSGRGTKLNWKDYYRNRFLEPRPKSPIYQKPPSNVSTQIELSPSGDIVVSEQVESQKGNLEYRPTESIDLKDYNAIQNRRVFDNLLRDYAGKSEAYGAGRLLPKLDLPPSLDRLLGNDFLDLMPNGFVTMDIGFMNQFNDNPSIPIRQRRNFDFVFKPQININFNAKISERLGFLTNYDTKASFKFENLLKLNYKGKDESFIKSVQAGNVNWITNTQLIPGMQNLFGLKTEMQFGRLRATFVASQQRSRKDRIVLRGGAQGKEFEIRSDNYEENKHFFLSHLFREQYEKSLKTLPNVTSPAVVTRIEVYVTNRTANTAALRNVVGFTNITENSTQTPVDMREDPLYRSLLTYPAFRQVDQTNTTLTSAPLSLKKNIDYELLRGAKKLTPERDYIFNPQLGYLSLVVPLRNDEVLAVAYEYTYRGRSYKVGELTEDYQNLRDDEVIALKLLKSSTIRNNTAQPMWDLMMKNIYSLGGSQIDKQGFQLRIIYKDDVTGIDNPNLQVGRRLQNLPLVRAMMLDRMNNVGDFQADGNFDYVEGYTVDPQNGRIIFPVLEPFGKTIASYFDADEAELARQYVFDELYRTTMIEAQQINEKNKYYLKGSYMSANGADIQLPFGVSEESVMVMSGGVALARGSDYIVEAQAGRLRIVNPSVMNSGREIVVEYEKPDLFDNQIRTLVGTRLDYLLNKDVRIGMTAMHYNETPAGFLKRVAIGNEPASNTIIGVDGSIRKEAPFLTRLLDKLPLIQTKEMSYIHFKGEAAQLFPGLNRRVNGRAIVDDFETSRTVYDLARQATMWKLGATPQNSVKFPFNGAGSQKLDYAFNRGKISVYNVDNVFSGNDFGANIGMPVLPESDVKNHYERMFMPQELFPGKALPVVNLPLTILDVAYYPAERGMYNYNPDLTSQGRLKDPKKSFAAVTRAISADNDFDNANIETIDFWLLNPFINSPNGVVRAGYTDASGNNIDRTATGGKLVFNLGDISEDIIPDERYNFENGLPIAERVVGVNVDSTQWGYVTRQQFVINAFSNEPGGRARQDVGFDGMNSNDERAFFAESFLNKVESTVSPQAMELIRQDPSGDDFDFYLGEKWDAEKANVLQRYKNFLGTENNSPESTQNRNQFTQANTNLPDGEDLNTDNTINNNEEYYEYEIDLQPGQLEVGKGYIVDKTSSGEAEWYLFRIPVREFTGKTDNMNSFKSIRFMRMYLTDFENPVVLRFAQLQLVGQQYRKYTYDLNAVNQMEVPEKYDAKFTVGTVSVEENGQVGSEASGKYVYAVPPGWERDRDFTQPNQNFLLNEQAMSLCVTGLKDGDSRGVFKNVNLDLQFRKRLKMYVHMHSDDPIVGGTGVFMRLGTDVSQNYYEVEKINLIATRPGDAAASAIWPEANEMNFLLEDLINAKSQRNREWGRSYSQPYSVTSADGQYRITVMGNPDLSLVRVVMIGARNPVSEDERPQSFCLWVNEMHAEGFDQTAGWSAIGQLDAKLADLATIKATGRVETFGFGGVQTKIGERSRAFTSDFGIASNISVDKFLPENWGFSIPLFLNYDRKQITPTYDPLDPDMRLNNSLDNLRSFDERERYKRMVVDNTTRRGINLSNVRKMRVGTSNRTPHLYDFENFAFTYAFNDLKKSNILTESFLQKMYKGGIAYAFSKNAKPFEPFKKWKTTNAYTTFIKDFNLNLYPTSIAIRGDVERSFVRTQLRNAELTTDGQLPYFEKFFWFNRFYDLTWNLTKSMVVSYNASARAIVDEPYGDLDSKAKKDTLWRNFANLGRIKDFDQRINLTWRLPLDKIPFTDWIAADYNHRIGYNFMANALGAVDENGAEFGNILRNSRERGISGRVDFVALYNKLRYLKFANTPRAAKKNFTRSPGDIEEARSQSSQLLKDFTRVLMTVRGINVSYSVLETTALPGFLGAPRFFGMDKGGAPGLGFVLGEQQRDFQKQAASRGWLTTSRILNQPFQQTIDKRFEANTTLEPFKDLQINVKADYTRKDVYQEFYRPDEGGVFRSESPLRNGQYSMSFLSFRTALAKMNRDHTSPVFDNFIKYRQLIADRLNRDVNNIGEGTYNGNSQDVLIPAFFAAYSGRGADSTGKMRTSPFLKFPFPNWSVRYNGLSQIPLFKNIFQSFSLEHNYTSTYSVGNFTSSLNYEEMYVNLAVTGYLMASNLVNNNPLYSHVNEYGHYIPVFAMSTITMAERFSPLIGVNFRTTGALTGRIDYNRDRTVALNLANTQMQELFNQDLTVTLGFTKSNVAIPFKINGVRKRLKNDLTAQMSVTFRDTRSIQRKIIEIEEAGVKREVAENTPTAGNINFQLRPTINYVVSNRLTLQFYFERMFNDPLVSNSFYRSVSSGGVQLRFNLGE